MEVTTEQIIAYFKVQIQGRYNMLNPEARIATGLDEGTYDEIRSNYKDYRSKYSSYYESLEISELHKISREPVRKLTSDEKAYFSFYSGFMMAIGLDDNPELNENQLGLIIRLKNKLSTIY